MNVNIMWELVYILKTEAQDSELGSNSLSTHPLDHSNYWRQPSGEITYTHTHINVPTKTEQFNYMLLSNCFFNAFLAH